MPIRCEIVSQDNVVFQDDVDIVVLPGIDGTMGILPEHSPVLTVLKFGIISVRSGKTEQFFTVAGGIAEVQPDQVTVLADAAENVEEIDIRRAEDARLKAEQRLSEGTIQDDETYLAIQAALQRSNLRLSAVRRYKNRK